MNVFDLDPVWYEILLPIIFPLFLQHGVLFLGLPGIGKTPTFIVLAMALGRYRCQGKTDAGRPGWRRGKTWDDFKDVASVVEVAAFLDDPTLPTIHVAGLKNFTCNTDSATTRARYNDAKFAKGQFCGVADNEFDEDDEPENDVRTLIQADEFFKLVHKAFGYEKKSHCMAILKRCVTFVAGKRALYVRLPSGRDDAPAHRITKGSITKDWLKDPGH